MCLRWQLIHNERKEQWRTSSAPPLSRPKNGAWQPPPAYAFAGGSTMEDEKLWRRCLDNISAGITRETDPPSRDNMRACLCWVKLHGYPSTDYFLVWAACGIATCSTRREFSRFWAAHGQCPERMSVYALQVLHDPEGTVVNWRYGLAAANLGGRPPRVGYEETWPEYFSMPEWLDEISWEHIKVRADLAYIMRAPESTALILLRARRGTCGHHWFGDRAADINPSLYRPSMLHHKCSGYYDCELQTDTWAVNPLVCGAWGTVIVSPILVHKMVPILGQGF